MTNKGILRQAYVKFYAEEAKQIISEFNNRQSSKTWQPATSTQPPKLSDKYNKYTQKILILMAVSFISFIIGLFPIGIIGIIAIFCLFVFMPKDLKQEADAFNKWQDKNMIIVKNPEDINLAKYCDEEADLKAKLMQKFLAIFGDFKWQKWESFFNINNLIILPDKLSLYADDCIEGKYENTNIKMTEVFFGWKAICSAFKNHQNKLGILVPCLFVFFFVIAFTQLLPIPENIKNTLPFYYMGLFLLVWGMGFFTIPIMIIVYLMNKDNRGLIIEIDMPKNFEGETVLFENALTNLIVNKKALRKFERTSLEDTEFNKKYFIYTTNQIEARYVLTTAFVERLKNIKFKFAASYLRMRFKNNRITIFASVHKDLFKMAKRGEKTDMRTFDVLFEEIHSVLSLVDELKLNVRTGL